MQLGQSIRHGAAWVLSGNLSVQILQFAVGVVLARLLVPADFGILVTIQIFTGVAGFLASGGMVGIVGGSSLLVEDGRFAGDFQTGIGFTGIAVALVGRNHPVGVALGALLWGFMERAAQRLDLEGVPKEIVVIMQGTIVLSVVVAYEVVRRARAAQQQREVSAQVDDERVADTTAGVPA